MHDVGVWKESTAAECWAMTGKAPVTTKWVDVNKGRDGEVNIRSRLVAKRLLFRMAMLDGSVGGDRKRGAVKLLFIDTKKAHLNGKLAEDEYAYVRLPPEAGGGVGSLRGWLYGMA